MLTASESRLGTTLQLAAALLGTEITTFNRVDGDVLTVVATRGRLPGMVPGAAVPLSDTFCGRAMAGAPAVVSDADAEPAHADTPARRALGVRTYVGLQVRGRDDRLVGTLCGFDRKPVTVPERALRALRELADDLGRQVEDLGALDVVVLRHAAGYAVAGVAPEDNAEALAGLVDEAPRPAPVHQEEWLRDTVQRLECALQQRVIVEQQVGAAAERWHVPPAEALRRLRAEQGDVPGRLGTGPATGGGTAA
ncbi:MAG: GAF domain-containing protein [Actinomycetota bacterium]|nr:GAF domain-containing protein [Actinomycetota bacterium]